MQNRWAALAVLFLARASMAFQFQAVASLSPLIAEGYGVGLAEIGTLIGLYLAPGLAIALPGGAIGRRLGDKPAVTAGMAMMLAGALIMATAPGWGGQLAGRLLAGTGGVVLNVLMTKMVTDAFAGREIATAMGIFINSWPVGIALALLVLPVVGDLAGLGAAQWLVVAATAGGLALFALGYRPAAGAGAAPPAVPLSGAVLGAVLLAGAIWGLYNGALGMVFGFGPALLVERGWSLTEAGTATSLSLWSLAVALPVGGYLADRLGRPDLLLASGLLAMAALFLVVTSAAAGWALFVLIGLAAGVPAAPIMSLPARVLGPGSRAMGMGVFFTVYYVGIFVSPIVAGWLSEAAGTAEAAFLLGVALLAACLPALIGVRALVARIGPTLA